MNLSTPNPAAPRCDVWHHRNHFGPAVRAALGLLDRVEEGQDVAARDVDLALQVTGDAVPVARQGPSWEFDRPTWQREPHPSGRGRP